MILLQSTRGTGSVTLAVAGGDRLHPAPPRQVHVGVGTSHEVLPAANRRQCRVPEVKFCRGSELYAAVLFG